MFAKGHANVRIFSYQDHYNGQRRFLVSTYKEFWQRFSLMTFSCVVILVNVVYIYIYLNFSACADRFNFRYKRMDSKFRHHYEVIQEVKIVGYSFHK